MRITDLLDKQSISLNGVPKDKKEALDQVVDLMAKSGKINDVEAYRQRVYAREEESTTGIGEGIAIPHGKCDAVAKPGLAAMVVKDGVDFDSLDGEPVHLIFLIAAPNTEDNIHLDVLSKLSVLLMDEQFTADLLNAKSVDEFLEIVDKADDEKSDIDERLADTGEAEGAQAKLLAVTACPTGIAHTYMAAEGLEKAAKAKNCFIKIETRGSGGAKNVITDQEIAEADCIIVTADTQVPLDRFDGKKVIIRQVSDGISKADELVDLALSGNVPVYHAAEGAKTEVKSSGGIGHQIYAQLMNGVSHMLPFVIGGGILIAIAFLIDGLSIDINSLPADQRANFGTITPIAAMFKQIGGVAFGFMLPVLAGFIAMSIADRPGLAVGFTGGLLAANGNAVLAKYVFANESLGGFSKFISNFAFVGENGGNTVSGFLGGIAAGFVAGFIVLGLKKLCSKLPDSLEGIKPTLIYPLVGIFLIGILMTMVFNPLIGLINTGLSNMLTSISDAGMITVLGLILGAMMAIDMGGPINKAAYVFGSGMLATASQMMAQGAQASDPAVQACYMAMASIMVGGMVPPVGIAAACKLFPRKFTKAEQGSAVSNIVMGCSFITEGAIPFAASDPLHVIPCTMAGAGVAGLLSALFGCTLMAPHGGVFVFATVGQPLLYIVAWLVGSAVTAVMLGFIKKDAKA